MFLFFVFDNMNLFTLYDFNVHSLAKTQLKTPQGEFIFAKLCASALLPELTHNIFCSQA